MQGTVASFDPVQRAGLVLLDNGQPVEFTAPAFDASGLRLLRVGQRVRMEQDASGRIINVTIPTF